MTINEIKKKVNQEDYTKVTIFYQLKVTESKKRKPQISTRKSMKILITK